MYTPHDPTDRNFLNNQIKEKLENNDPKKDIENNQAINHDNEEAALVNSEDSKKMTSAISILQKKTIKITLKIVSFALVLVILMTVHYVMSKNFLDTNRRLFNHLKDVSKRRGLLKEILVYTLKDISDQEMYKYRSKFV